MGIKDALNNLIFGKEEENTGFEETEESYEGFEAMVLLLKWLWLSPKSSKPLLRLPIISLTEKRFFSILKKPTRTLLAD